MKLPKDSHGQAQEEKPDGRGSQGDKKPAQARRPADGRGVPVIVHLESALIKRIVAGLGI